MALTISQVIHYPDSNCLEVSWVRETIDPDTGEVTVVRKRCISYSPQQKAKFLSACGAEGDKYVLMAGW